PPTCLLAQGRQPGREATRPPRHFHRPRVCVAWPAHREKAPPLLPVCLLARKDRPALRSDWQVPSFPCRGVFLASPSPPAERLQLVPTFPVAKVCRLDCRAMQPRLDHPAPAPS